MAERPDQIEKHIESTRNQLGSNLQELEDKVKSATDWHTHFERSPMTILGAAFGGGVLLATLMGPGKRRNNENRHSRTYDDSPKSAAVDYQKGKASATLENIKGALIGLAAMKVRGLLGDAIPGFHEQYEKTERKASSASDERAHPVM